MWRRLHFLWCWNGFLLLLRCTSLPSAAAVDLNSLVSGNSTGVSWESSSWDQSFEQVLNPTSVRNYTLTLAADHTARPDPLNNLHKYYGGWNISDQHYWASVVFTGSPGFILAASWITFGMYLLLLSLCYWCCCREKLQKHHGGGSRLPLLMLLLFTSTAVAGCMLLYTGQRKFHDEISDTLHYVVNQADTVVGQLRNVSSVLTVTEAIHVLSFSIPDSERAKIEKLNARISTAANQLEIETHGHSEKIQIALNNLRFAMIIVATVMLLFVFLGLTFAISGVQRFLYLLVSIEWFSVAITWTICGLYILLHNCMGDTCIAMGEWVNNPLAKTSMDRILPCVDVGTAHTTLEQAERLTNETVTGINSVIINALNKDASSGPRIPVLCNAVQPQFSASGCLNLTDATQVWAPYICNHSISDENCMSRGRITPHVFEQLKSSAQIVHNLSTSASFLLDLEDCDFVRHAFTSIRLCHCDRLREFTKLEYLGLALVSGGSMLSVVFQIVYTRRHSHLYEECKARPTYSLWRLGIFRPQFHE